jgi:hypothetical protein
MNAECDGDPQPKVNPSISTRDPDPGTDRSFSASPGSSADEDVSLEPLKGADPSVERR